MSSMETDQVRVSPKSKIKLVVRGVVPSEVIGESEQTLGGGSSIRESRCVGRHDVTCDSRGQEIQIQV